MLSPEDIIQIVDLTTWLWMKFATQGPPRTDEERLRTIEEAKDFSMPRIPAGGDDNES